MSKLLLGYGPFLLGVVAGGYCFSRIYHLFRPQVYYQQTNRKRSQLLTAEKYLRWAVIGLGGLVGGLLGYEVGLFLLDVHNATYSRSNYWSTLYFNPKVKQIQLPTSK